MELVMTEQDFFQSPSWLIVITLNGEEYRQCGGDLVFFLPGLSQRYFTIHDPYLVDSWSDPHNRTGNSQLGRFVNGEWQGVLLRDDDVSEDMCVTSIETVKLALARNINTALKALDGIYKWHDQI